MKVSFNLKLNDNDKNRKKENLLSKLEILFDDIDNNIPEEYYNFITNMSWKKEYKITFEEL